MKNRKFSNLLLFLWNFIEISGAVSAFSRIPSQGVINLEQLSEVWQAPYYPQNTHPLLLSVLSALDLAFPLHADRGRIIVPSQLPETPVKNSVQVEFNLKRTWIRSDGVLQQRKNNWEEFSSCNLFPMGSLGESSIISCRLHLNIRCGGNFST